jgi:hypothetical protein
MAWKITSLEAATTIGIDIGKNTFWVTPSAGTFIH